MAHNMLEGQCAGITDRTAWLENMMACKWVLICWAGFASLALASEDAVMSEVSATGVTRMSPALPKPTGRLKFKTSGPVCMCGEGMSEKDIARSLKQKTELEHATGRQVEAVPVRDN